MVVIPAVAVKQANVKIPGVFKCLFGLHGAQCIRSNAKKMERRAKKCNQRGKNKNDVDYDGL